ncbi:MAG: transglutaminase domain-containing protein [Bacillota bacterium]
MTVRRWRNAFLYFALWSLLVFYPNPWRLGVSLVRIARAPLDAEAVSELAARMPESPADIERYVLTHFPYQHDWLTYGVPWYYPSVKEALARGTGDCKTRFVILASLFEALGIPYRQTVSLSHYWVTYEGKPETALESGANAWLVREEGRTRLQLPREDWRQIWESFLDAFWHAMPPLRKFVWLTGVPLTLWWTGRGRQVLSMS